MAIPELYFNGHHYVYRDWLGRRHDLPNAQDPEEGQGSGPGVADLGDRVTHDEAGLAKRT